MTARRLVLIRHSKTAAGPIDVERRLADRGFADAAALGRWLTGLDIAPDRVVVSTAVRAQQTWQTAAKSLAAASLVSAPDVIVDERVYDNTVEDLLAVIRDTPESVATLAIAGHNPSMGETAAALDDGMGTASARAAIARSYPTSGVAVFDVATGWAQVSPGGAALREFAAPRG